jgi:membrane protease YdiL (CAAX protease family)
MLQNFSKLSKDLSDNPPVVGRKHNWWMVIIIPAWVIVCFFVAQILIIWLVWLLNFLNIPLGSIDQVVLNTMLTSFVYIITLVFVIIVPLLIKKIHTTRFDIGLTRLTRWIDILLTPAGLIVYLILSTLLILMATRVLPWFDVNQVQDVGFSQVSQRYDLILVFTTLVIIAPVAEEILFRGYLYGKLRKFVPVWVAILVTSVVFGTIHGAWNLAIDTFALSVVLCLLREFTGNIWASILLHMVKNGIAFYILFIYPTLLTTLVR